MPTLSAWTLGPRQILRYKHLVNIWRPSEAEHALNGRYGGIRWEEYAAGVPGGINPTPSHIEPAEDLLGPQVETDILFTIDTWAFPQEVLLIGGDVLQMAGFTGDGIELRIGRYWMVRGNEQPHPIHARQIQYLCKIIMEVLPGSDFPGIQGSGLA